MAGIAISKAVPRAVLTAPAGAAIAKTNVYVILYPQPSGVNITKTNAYAVLREQAHDLGAITPGVDLVW